MILSKDDILNGKNAIQEIEIEKLGGSLKLRPLTDGEIQEINRLIQQGGLKPIKGKVEAERAKRNKKKGEEIDFEVDPMMASERSYDADVKAVFYGLQHDESPDTYTTDEIKSFPAGSVEEIALKVFEISGIDDPNKARSEMEKFREEE
jgi:hypothetical protein